MARTHLLSSPDFPRFIGILDGYGRIQSAS